MTTQLYRVVFATAILATAAGVRAGESAMTTGRRDAASIASAAVPAADASASQGRAAAASRDVRSDADAPSRLDCPSDVPSAPGAASLEAGFADPQAQLVWVGP